MQELSLSLTVEETNLVLEGLGTLPFARVYALVAKIQTQATGQMKGRSAGGDPAGSPDEGGKPAN